MSGLVVLLVVAALSLSAGPAEARSASSAPPSGRVGAQWPREAAQNETAFIRDVNQLRASRGLPVLKVHPNLTRKARQWATTMAAARKIWHSRVSAGVTARWQKLGENVGMGASEPQLHDAFVASGSHLGNLIDPAFKSIGVGVVISDGIMFVSEVFLQPPSVARRSNRRPASGLTTQRLLRAQPVRPLQPQPALAPLARTASALFRPIS